MFFTLKKPPATIPEEISGVRVRASTRAKNMALQVDSCSGDVVLTLPRRFSIKKATSFIETNQLWIKKHRTKADNITAHKIIPGSKISFLGQEYTVLHMEGRGIAYFGEDTIVIRGNIEHFPRRLRDALKKEAKPALTELVEEKTARLDLKMQELRIIDPKTRWGSCAPDGRIMLSWRLALAPPDVMDYVVAHEVAHRIHMNHSARFWKLCQTLSHTDVDEARLWIRKHGDRLMRCI